MMRGITRALAALGLALLVSGDALAAGGARFEAAPCPMRGASSAEAEGLVSCGYLVVPERRDRPDARTLKLAVARLASRASEPEKDPVVFLHGGPGGHAIWAWKRWLDHPLLDSRELILLDQRGTGYSQPVLCPDLGLEDFRILAQDMHPEQETRERIEVARRCRDRLAADGYDLGAWNSDTSADDLADLRRSLGIEQWNVFGISYGTKLALTLLRDHPEGVRSVILDSVYPPGIPGNVRFGELERAVDTLVAGCAANPDCAKAYPDLHGLIAGALAALEREPLVIPVSDRKTVPTGRFTVNAQELAISLHQGLYDRRVIPLLPLLMQLARDGKSEQLVSLVDASVQRANDINRAVYHTVECFERGPFMVPSEKSRRWPELQHWMVFFQIDEALCADWWPTHAEPDEALPVRSDVPALVMAGRYDPITPPAWSRLAAGWLSNSTYVEFPGVGHGASRAGDCPESIQIAFLADPGAALDTSCAAAMPEPDFVTALHSEPGVYLFARDLVLEGRTWMRAALGLVVAALLVAIAGAVRGVRLRGPERRARLLVGGGAVLALLFFAGLAGVLVVVGRSNPFLIGFGVPRVVAPLFWLPFTVMLVTIAGIAVLLPAWGGLGRGGRFKSAVGVAGLLGFLLICRGFGLL